MKLIYMLIGLILVLALIEAVHDGQLEQENIKLKVGLKELMAADEELKAADKNLKDSSNRLQQADDELKRVNDRLMASSLELQRVCASRLR